jgi:hypothetical protein
MENSLFVSDVEVNRYINESISDLYDQIIEAAGQEWFLTSYRFTPVAGQSVYNLPHDFYLLKGVDMGEGDAAYPVLPYNFDERFHQGQVRYRLKGFATGAFPNQGAGGEEQVAPGGILPGALLGKINGLFTGNTILELTNSDHTSSFYIGQRLSFTADPANGLRGFPPYTIDVTEVSVPFFRVRVSGNVAIGGVLAGDLIYDGVTGQYTPQIEFVPTTFNQTSVAIHYIPHAPELKIDTAVWNGFNGFEEFVPVDVAIKLMEKEESDPTALMLRRAKIERRIQSLAQARDHNFPDTIVDVNLTHGRQY